MDIFSSNCECLLSASISYVEPDKAGWFKVHLFESNSQGSKLLELSPDDVRILMQAFSNE